MILYEGAAIERYEIQTGQSGFPEPDASDIPDPDLRPRVDYVNPAKPNEFVDVKGPILTNDGRFDPTVTPYRVQGPAGSAIEKAQKNNGLIPVSLGGLNPPLPTIVIVDLFGLNAAEAAAVKSTIQNSGVPMSYFVILGE